MNIAILYTSYRQFEELDFAAEFLQQTGYLKQCDIIYHNNNKSIDVDALNQKLSQLPCRKLRFIYNPVANSGGYLYGHLEAICDAMNAIEDGYYDWVIHLHPDVFIVNEELLLTTLKEASAQDKVLVVTRNFGSHSAAFGTDFFAFRPSETIRAVFQSTLNSFSKMVAEKVAIMNETVLFHEVYHHQVPFYLAKRYVADVWHRDLDCLGLWHEHDMSRVRAYLENPSARWRRIPVRCLRKPKQALYIAKEWLQSYQSDQPNESLLKLLTKVEVSLN